MFCQLFGKFLIEKEVISQDTYKSIMEKLSDSRAKLGVIAVADGIITEKQANEINHLQTTKDARFGEIAVGEGYMTEEQLDVLLKKQGSAYAIFLSVLSEAAGDDGGICQVWCKPIIWLYPYADSDAGLGCDVQLRA